MPKVYPKTSQCRSLFGDGVIQSVTQNNIIVSYKNKNYTLSGTPGQGWVYNNENGQYPSTDPTSVYREGDTVNLEIEDFIPVRIIGKVSSTIPTEVFGCAILDYQNDLKLFFNDKSVTHDITSDIDNIVFNRFTDLDSYSLENLSVDILNINNDVYTLVINLAVNRLKYLNGTECYSWVRRTGTPYTTKVEYHSYLDVCLVYSIDSDNLDITLINSGSIKWNDRCITCIGTLPDYQFHIARCGVVWDLCCTVPYQPVYCSKFCYPIYYTGISEGNYYYNDINNIYDKGCKFGSQPYNSSYAMKFTNCMEVFTGSGTGAPASLITYGNDICANDNNAYIFIAANKIESDPNKRLYFLNKSPLSSEYIKLSEGLGAPFDNPNTTGLLILGNYQGFIITGSYIYAYSQFSINDDRVTPTGEEIFKASISDWADWHKFFVSNIGLTLTNRN